MDRGQAHTLEAIAAALLLLTSVGFALQMTAVTPLSASTSSQHLENQLKATGEGVLASAAETGALKNATLYWDNSTGQFHNVSELGYYTNTTDDPETDFERALDRTFDRRNVAYNVYIVYHTSDTEWTRKRFIYQGEPSDHAVSASRTVTLLDDDRLVDADGSLNATTVENASTFYAPDVGNGTEDRPLYNHVRVEVVAWRI